MDFAIDLSQDESPRMNNAVVAQDLGQLTELNTEKIEIEQDLNSVKAELDEACSQLALLQNRIDELREKRKELEASLQRVKGNAHGVASSTQWDTETFTHSEKAREALLRLFGFEDYRPFQLRAINATLSGIDTFVVMPTGSGKSLIYQLPAVVEENKLTVVISPLLSLSRDQLFSLDKKNIPAVMISSEMGANETKEVFRTLGNMRLLYVTPEKISKSKKLLGVLEKMYESDKLARFVVDEAHCCSMMGHDFRPDYQKLHILKNRFPECPILAVTATATKKVESEICSTLLGRAASTRDSWMVFRSSFNRTNLFYEVVMKEGTHEKHVASMANIIQTRFPGQCGIVYCFSRKNCVDMAIALQGHGVHAAPYHAYIDSAEKELTHRSWSNGDTHVICATTAFGMGIDKPDVRFVMHATMPKNMEAYCQESGRAGRDGLPATCLLFYKRADVLKVSCLVSTMKNADTRMNDIIRYCENVQVCRREIMAKCFGERFNKTKMCDQMCDICTSDVETLSQETDVTPYAKNIMQLLESLRMQGRGKKGQRTTMNQLISQWRSSNAQVGADLVLPKSLSIHKCEQMCIQMILSRFLQIHWTDSAYCTNSYIKPGPYAKMLTTGTGSLKYHVLEQSSKRGTKRKTPKKPTATSKKRTISSKDLQSQVEDKVDAAYTVNLIDSPIMSSSSSHVSVAATKTKSKTKPISSSERNAGVGLDDKEEYEYTSENFARPKFSLDSDSDDDAKPISKKPRKKLGRGR
mmetsp:Transcript_44961/g.71829  ORF Transcript_44961/g.71829 Transcript_44961/m.71829 type:complete len:753 (-) Transcript_44961:1556-3814(-)